MNPDKLLSPVRPSDWNNNHAIPEEPLPDPFGSKRNRISLGILLVVLAVGGAAVTYKYTPPIGSVFLFCAGMILIFFWQRWMNFIRGLTGNVR